MKFRRYKYLFYSLGIVIIAGFWSACEYTSPHEEFIEGGSIIYPGTPDSVFVYPGKNRIQLSFPLPYDPSVSKVRVYWHNGRDSVEVPVDISGSEDTVDIMLTDMEEGSYTFDIFTYDNEGNISINVAAIGEVYGDNYINSLLPRLINEALFADDVLTIQWDNAGGSVIGTEVSYMSSSGGTQDLLIPVEEDSTGITDYNFEANDSLRYRTLYLPDSTAIDTFYTAVETVRVLGPRVALSKEGWTATASSYDERHGTDRAPGSAIDNDPGTIWVNSIDPQTDFPHSITIDMGTVEEGIDGLSFIVQDRNETPRTIEISVSSDEVNWTGLGTFPLESTATTQYIDFMESQDLRYVEVVAVEPHGSTPNVVIGEIGIYRR